VLLGPAASSSATRQDVPGVVRRREVAVLRANGRDDARDATYARRSRRRLHWHDLHEGACRLLPTASTSARSTDARPRRHQADQRYLNITTGAATCHDRRLGRRRSRLSACQPAWHDDARPQPVMRPQVVCRLSVGAGSGRAERSSSGLAGSGDGPARGSRASCRSRARSLRTRTVFGVEEVKDRAVTPAVAPTNCVSLPRHLKLCRARHSMRSPSPVCLIPETAISRRQRFQHRISSACHMGAVRPKSS
jgi:hypothetical protein